MNNAKVTCFAFMMGVSILLPTVVGAAATTSPASLPGAAIPETKVNGVSVPGNYVVNADSRVAFIPGGVGLIVINKDVPLPKGAYYVK
jgi:hypothetical protein